MVFECHPCLQRGCCAWFRHELTSTGHSGTKRTLTPTVALQTAVPGESELERGAQS